MSTPPKNFVQEVHEATTAQYSIHSKNEALQHTITDSNAKLKANPHDAAATKAKTEALCHVQEAKPNTAIADLQTALHIALGRSVDGASGVIGNETATAIKLAQQQIHKNEKGYKPTGFPTDHDLVEITKIAQHAYNKKHPEAHVKEDGGMTPDFRKLLQQDRAAEGRAYDAKLAERMEENPALAKQVAAQRAHIGSHVQGSPIPVETGCAVAAPTVPKIQGATGIASPRVGH